MPMDVSSVSGMRKKSMNDEDDESNEQDDDDEPLSSMLFGKSKAGTSQLGKSGDEAIRLPAGHFNVNDAPIEAQIAVFGNLDDQDEVESQLEYRLDDALSQHIWNVFMLQGRTDVIEKRN